MRAEQLHTSETTLYKIAGQTVKLSILDLHEKDENEVDSEAKRNFRTSLEEIRAAQNTVKEDGYIFHQGVIYRVHHGTGGYFKLTGAQAKSLKREFKSS